MKEKSFCFIICSNNEILTTECQNYINRLYIPQGYGIDIITINDADSLASAYNAAMNESNAKIKIYLHQDLFIVNRWFLYNILNIFDSDDSISIIGMIGTDKLPPSGVMWRGERVGCLKSLQDHDNYDDKTNESKYYECVAVDGAIIVTSYDVTWRADLFDGFDFYDVSECLEHRRKGYRVVVPVQTNPWCIHDDGNWMNIYNYNKYRLRLISEYSLNEFSINKDISNKNDDLDDGYIGMLESVSNSKELYKKNENEFYEEFDRALRSKNVVCFLQVGTALVKRAGITDVFMSGNIQKLINISRAVAYENRMGVKTFITGVDSVNGLLEKYTILEMYLRRIELEYSDDFANEAFLFIYEYDISAYLIAEVLYQSKSIYNNKLKILTKIADYYSNKNEQGKMVQIMAQIEMHK